MMAVIFPFETAYYQAANVPVRYVGHPSVDTVHVSRSKADNLTHFSLSPQQTVVGLLPGSRLNEVKRLLPVMLAAATILQTRLAPIQFVLPQASSISDPLLDTYLQHATVPVKVIKNQTYDVISCCDAVMTTSGTATLEIALLTVPMVITYKLSPLTYWLGKLLVKIPYIGLPNIIAGKLIVKELIQHDANPQAMAAEIEHILQDPSYRQSMLEDLQTVKIKLGDGGGSRNTALLALQLLENKVE